MTEALQNQRDRAVRLRHHLRRLGDMRYHPEVALLHQMSPHFPRFTGYAVHQNSMEYALLLLAGDDRLYGIDDAIEANRIIRRITRHQIRDTDRDDYGNYLGMSHWDRAKGRLAVYFLTPNLVHAYLAYGDKLEDETKRALERCWEPALACIRAMEPPCVFRNSWLMSIASLVCLSRVTDDGAAHDEAVDRFDQVIARVSERGFDEYNSGTYTAVSLSGLEDAWAYTPDEQFRGRLRRAMDAIWYQVAVNITPNGFLGGAQARAYLDDVVLGGTLTAYAAHVKLGTRMRTAGMVDPKRARLIPVKYTLHDYVPPEAIRARACERREDVIRDRSGDLDRANVVRPGFSLASQTMEHCGGHSPPPYVLLVRDSETKRASVVALPDETYSHRPCAAFTCRQDGLRVAGRLHLELTEEQRRLHRGDPEYICEPRVLFGSREGVRAVRIGNVDWGGAPVYVRAGQAISVDLGDVLVGVIARPIDETGEPVEGRLTLAWGDDGELRLRICVLDPFDPQASNDPVDVLLLVEAADPEDEQDFRAFAARMTRQTLTAEAISAPVLAGDVLHRSALLTLRRGDLQRWVDGGAIPILCADNDMRETI